MSNKVLYEDRHFRVTPDDEGLILHFNLSNKDYRFGGLEVRSLISKKRCELEDALNKKIVDARLLLIGQGLTYDSVGFVLAQAYAIHGDLARESKIPKCQSEN